MRIGSNYQQSRQCKSLLREDLMADSTAAVEEVRDLLLPNPGSHLFLQLGCGLIIGGNYVVEGYNNPFRIP